MLQQQLHRVKRHAINKDWMFKMERGENTEELLGPAHTERGDQHGSTTFNNLCDLFNKLLLQSFPHRMILRRVGTFQDYPVKVLVLWVRPIDEPSGLAVEVSGVQQPLPVTLNNRLGTARDVPGVNQCDRAIPNIDCLSILQLARMLQHRLEIDILVGGVVSA